MAIEHIINNTFCSELPFRWKKTCSINCPCEHPNNRRSESLALTDLEVVDIVGLKGEDHEIDFLELQLRCAIVLKRMTVRLPGIFKEYPNVECDVYCNCGK